MMLRKKPSFLFVFLLLILPGGLSLFSVPKLSRENSYTAGLRTVATNQIVATSSLTATLTETPTPTITATYTETPTPTVNPIVPPGYEAYARYVSNLISKFGWVSIPIGVVIILLLLIIRTGAKSIGQKIEKATAENVESELAKWTIGRSTLSQKSKYLKFLRAKYSEILFGRVRTRSGQPLRIPLKDVFISLNLLSGLPTNDTRAGSDLPSEHPIPVAMASQINNSGGGRRDLIGAIQAIAKYPFVIILGEPGTGKTTLLDYITYTLSSEDNQLPQPLAGMLPIPVSVKRLSADLLSNNTSSLEELISQYYKSTSSVNLESLFQQALLSGRAIILLDGLNEANEIDIRRVVVEKVEAFYAIYREAGVRVVVTSRIAGYLDAPINTGDSWVGTLTGLSTSDIKCFLEKWCFSCYKEILPDGCSSDDAKQSGELLTRNIINDPTLLNLATRPLFLTILALTEPQLSLTPRTRVELYEKYLNTYIDAWTPLSVDEEDLEVAKSDIVELLAALALRMKTASSKETSIDLITLTKWAAEALVAHGMVRPKNSINVARRLLLEIRQRTGVLLEIKDGTYAFHHLAIQEYLAAQGVAGLADKDSMEIATFIASHLYMPAWHETLILCTGFICTVQKRFGVTSTLIKDLLEYSFPDENRHQSIVLIAELAAELGDYLEQDVLNNLRLMLLRISNEESCSTILRLSAGTIMAELGDPRPLDETMTVDGGAFSAGIGADDVRKLSEKFGPASFSLLRSQQSVQIVKVREFKIAKYPVTCSEFTKFLADTRRVISSEWDKGYYLKELSNFPAVNITWNDANEYCKWLTGRLRSEGRIGPGEVARLPTEMEWEKAARGTDGRVFPWGDNWIDGAANTIELGINRMLPVGILLRGESPYHALDMAGQVWEWTQDAFVTNEGSLAEQGRVYRVLRGGSCLMQRIYSATFFRVWELPEYRSGVVGFRYVIAYPIE